MEDRETRKLDKFERQDAFMVDNAADFPNDSPGDKIITLMRADIALVRQYAAGQVGGVDTRSMHIVDKEDDLEELVRLMRLLDLAGDILADQYPGIENIFGVPRNRSEQSILAAARAQYDASEQYEAAIIEQEVPATFRADMLGLLDSIAAANQSADIAHEQGAGSTGGLKAAIARLDKNSKKLDAVNRIKYRNNPQKLAAWMIASHLERPPKKKKNES